MAIQTHTAVTFDNGSCVWEFDVDDVSLIITRVRCANQGEFPTRARAVVQKNGRSFSRLVPPGGSLDQALPTNPSGKFDITFDPETGLILGVDWYADYGEAVA